MRQWMKHAREKKNMTQKQVALKLGLTEGNYSLIERGKRHPSIELELAKKLEKVLDISLDEIMMWEAMEEGALCRKYRG